MTRDLAFLEARILLMNIESGHLGRFQKGICILPSLEPVEVSCCMGHYV